MYLGFSTQTTRQDCFALPVERRVSSLASVFLHPGLDDDEVLDVLAGRRTKLFGPTG